MLIPESLLERSDALNQLIETAGRSRKLPGQIAVISGEAGVGKSSLIAALAGALGDSVPVVWGHCDALFTPRHLGPFYDMAPLLGDGVQRALAGGGAPADLFPAVLSALNELPAGTVLVFEDIHWADFATLDLLKFVTRRLTPLRLLLVLSYRDEETGPDHPMTTLLGDLPAALTTRLDLAPLSEPAVKTLAERHGRDGARLFEVTGGNPFFLSEILAQPEDGDGHLPGSVRDAVIARVSRIGDDERALLGALCIAPYPVPLRVVERLAGEAGLEACANCEARGLLVHDGVESVRFRHELARMSLLEALRPGERQANQRRLLDVYLSLGDRAPSDRIVHHAAALGDARTLLTHAPRAAAEATAMGAYRQAASMLAAALRHVDEADPEQAAALYEDWAYQTSMFDIDDCVIDARREAVARWRALNQPDRVGDNLRWLWRLHWYRGEMEEAETAAEASLEILEAIPPSAELARAYALRSHVNLLRGRRSDSIEWGNRAIDMATQFGDQDTRLQALVSVASSMLFGGDAGGCELMEEALSLALANGFHEEAARVFTNYSEYAIVTGDWPLAERLVLDGLAFDIKHGLDSWTAYLMGRHAQLRLAQGRLAEAETLANGALAEQGRTILMQLPALTTLAITRSRIGADDAEALLSRVLSTALDIGEQQRITPVRLALIEHHYLREQWEPAHAHLEAMLAFGTRLLRPWDAGAVRLWARRLRVNVDDEVGSQPTEAQRLELDGDPAAAAEALDRRALPFDAAMCRLAGARAGHPQLLDQAVQGFDSLGCAAGADAARRLAEGQGVKVGRRPSARGGQRPARAHPLGLTPREVEVLTMMTEGASNAEIADRMSRSQRTVEHHVSSILGKLSASNRLEAILRVMAEPWIAGN
tara:strand:+ start:2819 stop:5470 length:2652 start_codon:yes stop_codon:yes gene_type:complete